MGFLSKLFSRSLSRDRWYIKIDLLGELSEIARKHWVQDWARLLTGAAALAEAGSRGPDARLEPRGDAALRAFQAHLTTHFIREHEYVPGKDQSEFTEQLLGTLIGAPAPETAAFMEQYAELGDRWDVLFSKVAEDVAAGLQCSSGASEIEATLPQFATEQQYITALCFGDTQKVRILKARIESADEISP